MSKYTLDQNISPKDDLYLHVNNIWIQDTAIPSDESRWGTFHVLREQALSNCRKILEDQSDNLLASTFQATMNKDANTPRNLEALLELLETVDKISDRSELPGLIAKLHRIDIGIFWDLQVDQDEKNPNITVLRLQQGGLSLPDRKYYLEDSEDMKKVREAYKDLHSALRSNLAQAKLPAFELLLATEKTLAEKHWSREDQRDAERMYNPWTSNEFSELTFDWQNYLKLIGSQHSTTIVNQTDYFTFIDELLTETALTDLKDYIKWHIVTDLGSSLSEEIAHMIFELYGKRISGQSVQKELWKRAVGVVEHYIGEELGKLYVQDHFPSSSKQEVLDMVENVRSAYSRRINNLEWMSDTSKQKAQKKLANMKVLIGYPDEWRDYSSYSADPTNTLKTMTQLREADHSYHLDMVGKPPKQTMWHMSPQTVNAYHDPNRLEIVFPAAILQDPFYSPGNTLTENYAGIGYVIGHELTHGFDDQGSKYDEHGALKPWLSEDELAKFHKNADHIKKAADAHEVAPGTFMSGDLVIGEAIADLGGAEISLDALSTLVDELDRAEYFKHMALVEKSKSTPEYSILQAKTDPHPEESFRTNQTAKMMDSYHDEFDTTVDDKMYVDPQDRARIW